MKPTLISFLTTLLISVVVLADVPKNIFDDNWKPEAQQTPAPPATDSTPHAPKPDVETKSPPADPVLAPAGAPRAAVEKPQRLPPPSRAAQADSWKLIQQDLFKDDIAKAKTSPQKVELARKLLGVAADTTKDHVGRYVLLAQAKELAIASGDPATAFRCLDDMGKSYTIDYPSMKLDLFLALSKTVSTPADISTLVGGLNQWADGQARSERYDTAKRACDLALDTARKDRDVQLAKTTTLHRQQIEEIASAYVAAKDAQAKLVRSPSDRAANLTLGRFYCFIKGDWEKGLHCLTLSSDTPLKTLAGDELRAKTNDALTAVADAWWDTAEKETPVAKVQIQLHSADLYEQAKPALSGLALVKAQKRTADARAAESVPGVASTLAEITVTTDADVSVETLRVGNERLSGHFRPPFWTVSTTLTGADFLRVPIGSNPSYKVKVIRGGIIYALGCFNGPPDAALKWQAADAALSGEYITAKFRTTVRDGDAFVVSSPELSLIAAKITIASH